MSFQEQSLWAATAPELESFADRPLPERGDVVIVGGGYTGLSAALHLARNGAKVTVLERESIGWGASSRNGGMALTGHKHGIREITESLGLERARKLWNSSLAALELVAETIQQEGIDCDFTRAGHFAAAYKPAHMKGLEATAALLDREFDYPTRIVPREELRTELGTEFYHGGLIDERSGGLHPAKYVRGLARAAQRAGADLHDATPALEISKTGNRFQVRTGRGTIACKDVIAATNGYTGAATRELQRRIIPLGSYIIATERLDAQLANQLIPHNRMVYDTKNFLYYFRRSPDDRIVFGGRAAFFPATPATVRESAEILRRGLLEIFPALEKIPTAYAWGGTLGFTFDLYPHMGERDGVHYAMGYGGHGVALATYLGKQLANKLSGQAWDNPFEGMEFRTAPFYGGNPWFLPFAAWYFRFLDMVS